MSFAPETSCYLADPLRNARNFDDGVLQLVAAVSASESQFQIVPEKLPIARR